LPLRTDLSSLPFCFQLPLSGSHGKIEKADKDMVTFNSLSRDHEAPQALQGGGMMPKLSTPSLGITGGEGG